MQTLLPFLFAGEKLPTDAGALSFGHEGWSWSFAGGVFVALLALTTWTYLRRGAALAWPERVGLIGLRALVLAVLLVLLVRPVLLVPLEETTRRPFVVLLDVSRSMELVDPRTANEDRVRAAIAEGAVDPAGGLEQKIAPDVSAPGATPPLSRARLLTALAANDRLALWPRLAGNAEVIVYSAGRQLAELGPLAGATPERGSTSRANAKDALTPAESAAFFQRVSYRDDVTALGDGLGELVEKLRGQPLSGLLVISDGVNNQGVSPIEAAARVQDEGTPFFVYGVGVTAAPDLLVSELVAVNAVNVKERVEVTVRLRANGLRGRRTTLQLTAAGRVVAEEPLEFRADGEQEVKLAFTPAATGEIELAAIARPLPLETVTTNNTATRRLGVLDEKYDVLLVQGEPTWEFQYLLALLQRDRRVRVMCVLLKGDAGLAAGADSPFIERLPEGRKAWFGYDLILLGDVSPAELGEERQGFLREWVGTAGGGLVFLAGPRALPAAYARSPLAPLLPVEPVAAGRGSAQAGNPQAVPLALTPAGAASALLKLADDPRENAARWAAFPGVRWTAPLAAIKPGAQVLLTDATAGKFAAGGPLPVLVQQRYGAGQTLYLGFDETYRWRAHLGEKHYARLWSQIIQALALRVEPGSSARTQLRLDRADYAAGDRVRISARVFTAELTPSLEPEVTGTFERVAAGNGSVAGITAPGMRETVRLQAVPDRPGEYRAEVAAPTSAAEPYRFSLTSDPAVAVTFRVRAVDVEAADIALNEKGLRSLAAAGGGRFLREEDLHRLPGWVAEEALRLTSFRKVPLTLTPALLALMIAAVSVEWFWRRRKELK